MNIYWATELRGFFKHLSSSPQLKHKFVAGVFYETKSRFRFLLGRIAKSRLFDILGYIDSNITINIIKNDIRVAKYHVQLPDEIVNVVKCKNPRCITSIEQELDQVFVLTDREKKIYRCKYCETSKEEIEND